MRRLVMLTVLMLLAAAAPLAAQDNAADVSHIRIAHFSPDAPLIDIFVNGELSDVTGLGFRDVSSWLALPADTYEVAIVPAGGTLAEAVFGPVSLPLTVDAWITAAAIGSLEADTLAVALILEDYITPLEADTARVTVFHGIEDAPAVDLRLADGTLLVPDIAFGSFASFDVPASSYDLQIVPAGATTPVVLDLTGTALEADNYYFVAAVGSLLSPDFALAAVAAVDVEMMMPADDTAAMDMTEEPAATADS